MNCKLKLLNDKGGIMSEDTGGFQFSILNYCIHYMKTIKHLIYCQLKGNKVMKGNS